MNPFPIRRRRMMSQAGFSMVEMLMTAFILAVGILGLTMLQTLSVRSSTGARGLSTAVLLAERTMDEITANGRNSLLYAHSTPAVTPSADLTDVFTAATPDRTFNFYGRPSVGDPIDQTPFFTVSVQAVTDPGLNPGTIAAIPGFGGVADMTVTVQWSEVAGAPARQVVLSRRVAYATAI